MSVTINLSERELKLSFFKIGLSFAFLIILIGLGFSLLADQGQSLALYAMFIAMACYFLTSSVLVVLKIVDWFEARKAMRNA